MTGVLKTVREAALEAELAQAKRRIRELEAEISFPTNVMLGTESVTAEVQLPSPVDVYRVARWTGTKDDFEMRVVGRTYGDKGIDYTYYVSNRDLYDCRDRLQLLGWLHERVIRELAAQCGKM